MKMTRLTLLLLAITAILMLTACRTAPVLNVDNAPIPYTADKALGMEKIQGAIIKAGTGLGWVMRPIKPGLIEASLNQRSHQAVVTITYTENDYNIDYKSSYNLKYNGTKIHRNYNNWIIYLNKAINNQLAMATY